MKKTNAARLLDGLGVAYELKTYEVDLADLGALHAAAAVGLPAGQVFKTLVARGDRSGVLLACISGGASLDLKRLATASGNKKAELVPLKEVQALTGYVRGGVSPLGAKKPYPVYLDERAFSWPRICVSAGQRGLQLFLAPQDLARAAHAAAADIAQEEGKDEYNDDDKIRQHAGRK